MTRRARLPYSRVVRDDQVPLHATSREGWATGQKSRENVRLNIAGKGTLQLPSQIASEVLLHRNSYIRIRSEIRF